MKNNTYSKCPVTGIRVTTNINWENIIINSKYRVSYKILENRILLGQAVGQGDINSLKKSLNLATTIIKENFKDEQFIYIEDFSKIINPTPEGRKYYIQFMKSLKNMKALIYYSVNPFLRLSIKLAKKLNLVKFDIIVTKNYSNAVEIALNILNKNNNVELISKNISEKKNVIPKKKVAFDDFTAEYEIINDNIFHVNIEGVLKKQDVDIYFDTTVAFIKKHLNGKFGNYYYLVNLRNFIGKKASRAPYLNRLQLLYKNFPFKLYIYYGGSRLINISIALSSHYINFKYKKENNLSTALSLINNIEEKNKFRVIKKEKKNIPDETQKYIDEFLIFLGNIDWEETNSLKNTLAKDEKHPFYQIYDAITLIKSDLDELYLERQKNKEEKRILRHKLQQSLKLETMGKLAGSVAHDLNNVLSGIVSYPDIILKELPQIEKNKKAIKYIKRMKISGQKAANIVHDLLTLSRSGIIFFEPVNINSIINEYLISPELQRLKTLKPKITVKCNLAKNLQHISGSSIHLSKTIMNLVTNAIEAISEKGVIKITTKNRVFNNKQFKNYEKKANGKYVQLIVSDNGLGIAEQDVPRIFEPFYSKKVMGSSGTGLGMMVVKGTVDDHNGFIIVNSKEGKGTELILYFPVKDECSSKKLINKINNYTGKGEKILVIDDDEDQRIISYKILTGLYYSVKTLSSGEEAVEYLKKEKVDLIVLDMIMQPGMGGLETYKEIKKINKKQKAVIVSGYSASDNVTEVQKLGAGKYLRKPYTMEALGIAVYKELNNL